MSKEIIKTTKEAFLTTFAPQNVQTHLRTIKSVKEAIKTDKNGVSYYRKNYGQTQIETILTAYLMDFQKSINVNTGLTPYQCDQIVNEILSTYYFLSPVEIAFIFKRAKLGHYKVNTFALSMPDIMQWFASYTEERIKEFQKIQEHENKTRKIGKEIIFDEKTGESKVFNAKTTLTEEKLLNVFKEVKKELKPKFNQKEYEQIKKQYDEK
jgi:hypothetical protein